MTTTQSLQKSEQLPWLALPLAEGWGEGVVQRGRKL